MNSVIVTLVITMVGLWVITQFRLWRRTVQEQRE